MPTPRFSASVARTATVPSTSSVKFTREVVEAMIGSQCRIQGHYVPTRGSLQVKSGDVVTVQWERGTPVMVLDYQTRRGGQEDEAVVAGVVEMLLIGKNAAGNPDVFYRSADIFTPLGLGLHLVGGMPETVQWSQGARGFFVRMPNRVYRVYEFDARKGKPVIAALRSTRTSLVRQETPLAPTLGADATLVDLTMTATWTGNLKVLEWTRIIVDPYDENVPEVLPERNFAISGSSSHNLLLKMSGLALPQWAPLWFVSDEWLDENLDLIWTIIFGLAEPPYGFDADDYFTGSGTLNEWAVEDGPYGGTAALDDDDRASIVPDVIPISGSGLGLLVGHAIVVNATRGEVLYTSMGSVTVTKTSAFNNSRVLAFLSVPGTPYDFADVLVAAPPYDPHVNQFGDAQSADGPGDVGMLVRENDLWDQGSVFDRVGKAPFIDRSTLYKSTVVESVQGERWIPTMGDEQPGNLLNRRPYTNRYIPVTDSFTRTRTITTVNTYAIGDLRIVRRPALPQLDVLDRTRFFDSATLWMTLFDRFNVDNDKLLDRSRIAPFIIRAALRLAAIGDVKVVHQLSPFLYASVDSDELTNGFIWLESASGRHALYRTILSSSATEPTNENFENLIKLADLDSGEVVTVADISKTNGKDPFSPDQWKATTVKFFADSAPLILPTDYAYAAADQLGGGVPGRTNLFFMRAWGDRPSKNATSGKALKAVDGKVILTVPPRLDAGMPSGRMRRLPASWTNPALDGPHAVPALTSYSNFFGFSGVPGPGPLLPLATLIPVAAVHIIQNPAVLGVKIVRS